MVPGAQATAPNVLDSEGNERDSQQRFRGGRGRNAAGVREGGTCTRGRHDGGAQSRAGETPQSVQAALRPHPPLEEAGGKEPEAEVYWMKWLWLRYPQG